MAPRDASDEPVGTPRPVEKGFATLNQLRVGVKVFAEKDGEKRKAEILSIKERRTKLTFYVHYEEFNKRLDEWIPSDRIDLSKEVEWPAPEKPEKKKGPGAVSKQQSKAEAAKSQKKRMSKLDREVSATPEPGSVNLPAKAPRNSKAGSKENKDHLAVIASEMFDGSTPKPEDEEMDLVDVADIATVAKAGPVTEYSREDELEKLRTSGSMTQNQTEISRVRNLDRVQMGKWEIEPWYFSPYPIDFTDCDIVYICEFCLSYFGELKQFERHRTKCTLLHPPGNEIYRDEAAKISFFEIDGRRQRTWCRNLCLLSKLFLDHKTLYYDVDPFLFYCMCEQDEHGYHLVGYFSKEKESAEGYNVACILTLPQYQRKGFGKLLIEFSYELSKNEGKLGSPEKPLSDLGLLGYRAYWEEVIVDLLMEKAENGKEANIEELSHLTAMTTNDVLHTLQYLEMLKYSKNQHVVVLTDRVLERYQKRMEKRKQMKVRRTINPGALQWKPPVFTASSRTWNW